MSVYDFGDIENLLRRVWNWPSFAYFATRWIALGRLFPLNHSVLNLRVGTSDHAGFLSSISFSAQLASQIRVLFETNGGI